jgi:hypothetical protein
LSSARRQPPQIVAGVSGRARSCRGSAARPSVYSSGHRRGRAASARASNLFGGRAVRSILSGFVCSRPGIALGCARPLFLRRLALALVVLRRRFKGQRPGQSQVQMRARLLLLRAGSVAPHSRRWRRRCLVSEVPAFFRAEWCRRLCSVYVAPVSAGFGRVAPRRGTRVRRANPALCSVVVCFFALLLAPGTR